jgi:hypothetical protein
MGLVTNSKKDLFILYVLVHYLCDYVYIHELNN